MNIIYEKPMIFENDDLSESVYMASGTGSGCYTASGYFTQKPQEGRGTYVIHIDGHHNSTTHSNDGQTITVSFNQTVNVTSCSVQCLVNNSSTIVLQSNYHQNGHDNIGLNDLDVTSDAGLKILSVTISDGK